LQLEEAKNIKQFDCKVEEGMDNVKVLAGDPTRKYSDKKSS